MNQFAILYSSRRLNWQGKAHTSLSSAVTRQRPAPPGLPYRRQFLARVDAHYADFTNLDAVAAVANGLVSQCEHIDVLVNNVGIHSQHPRTTVDGMSEMVSVNYLAPWLLMNVLRDKLVRSAPSRIVTVLSESAPPSCDPVRGCRPLPTGTQLVERWRPAAQRRDYRSDGTRIALRAWSWRSLRDWQSHLDSVRPSAYGLAAAVRRIADTRPCSL